MITKYQFVSSICFDAVLYCVSCFYLLFNYCIFCTVLANYCLSCVLVSFVCLCFCTVSLYYWHVSYSAVLTGFGSVKCIGMYVCMYVCNTQHPFCESLSIAALTQPEQPVTATVLRHTLKGILSPLQLQSQSVWYWQKQNGIHNTKIKVNQIQYYNKLNNPSHMMQAAQHSCTAIWWCYHK
jgi:hypothetical protein